MEPPIVTGSMHQSRGYTYFGVLFIVMLISLALTGAVAVWEVEQRREKEAELLFIGQQYLDAITSYYHSAPGGTNEYPHTINELLLDPRSLTVKRHLRKPWIDPLTGSKNWGIVRTKAGGIAGVFSNAAGQPLKQAGFGFNEKLLAGKSSYQDWKFTFIATTDAELELPADNLSSDNENKGQIKSTDLKIEKMNE